MNEIWAFLVFVMTIIEAHKLVEQHTMDFIPERRINMEDINNLDELPEAEPMLPGHTLLRPSNTMLKSAAKFPSDDTNAVYGNHDNLGITFGTTNNRVLYTGFRKENNMLATILNAIKKMDPHNGHKQKQAIILIDTDAKRPKSFSKAKKIEYLLNNGDIVPEENAAHEILDQTSDQNQADDDFNFRRRSRRDKYRNRDDMYSSSSDSDTSSDASSGYERNPGNPFTVHKNKYKQNWLWNHKMDGAHMNVNPYAPDLNSMGPTGAQLFFNRKWWYFNQDDYKPMG